MEQYQYAWLPSCRSDRCERDLDLGVRSGLMGFLLEDDAWWGEYRASGDRDGKFAFGGQACIDDQIANKIVIGREFEYWQPNHAQDTVGSITGAGIRLR